MKTHLRVWEHEAIEDAPQCLHSCTRDKAQLSWRKKFIGAEWHFSMSLRLAVYWLMNTLHSTCCIFPVRVAKCKLERISTAASLSAASRKKSRTSAARRQATHQRR